MKRLSVGLTIMIVALLLSSCFGAAPPAEEEGFDFSEEEVQDTDPNEPMEFTEDEVDVPSDDTGFDFSEEETEPETADEMEFTEEEIINAEFQVLPQAGITTWVVTNEIGTVDCNGMLLEFGPESTQTGTIEAGPEPDIDLLIVDGLDDSGDTIGFYKRYSQVAVYETEQYIPAGSDVELEMEMTFFNMEGGEYANYLEGTIDSMIEETIEGNTVQCYVFRTFYGHLVGGE